jgi:SET domain-containing protein
MNPVSGWRTTPTTPRLTGSAPAGGGQEADVTRFSLRNHLLVIVAATAVATAQGQSAYERSLEIRTSRIPHAGNGVFTEVAIPKGAYLGAYTGEFITEEEFLRRAAENRWQYMMGLLDCAKPRTGGISTIDGIHGNVFTRMNYAPPEFQNVKFEKACEAPFVKIVALRDIAAGEELWVDYGPRYRYDFMQDPEVIRFFESLRASGPRRHL